MKNQNSFEFLVNGEIHVFWYNYYKYFSPGQKVKVRVVTSPMKLEHLHYYWNDSAKRRKFPKISSMQCLIKSRVPKDAGYNPILTVVVRAGNNQYQFQLKLNSIIY